MITICNDLKASVLQAAIQGRLVPQIEAEGNAEDLYQEIQKEKEHLVKAKIIKKEKALEPIKDEEVPFDIPDSWKWVRLSEVVDVRDGTHDTPKYVETGVPLVTSKNLENGKINFATCKNISLQDAFLINQRSKVVVEDILFAMIGTIGNAVLVEDNREFAIKNMALFKRYNGSSLNMNYVKIFLDLAQRDIKKKATGGVQSFVSLSFLRNYLLPLPPLEEQKRVVAKVEKLLAKIDELEKDEQKLVELYEEFPGDMKASLLQSALQGRLVPQIEADGNAEDLYQEIQKKKEQLVKTKVINKETALKPISDEEIPFDIPDNWKWVRIGDIFKHSAGKALNSKNTEGTKLSYITTSNLYWNRFELKELREMYYKDSELEKCTAHKGDLLVCEGGDIGRAAIWTYDFDIRIQNHIHKLTPFISLDVRFYYYGFYLYKQLGMIGGKGIAIPGLSANTLASLVFPLPPLEEQKRIVAKIEELLPLCEKLTEIIA